MSGSTLHFQLNAWRRPSEQTMEDESQQIEWTVVNTKRFELVEMPHVVTDTERSLMRRKNLKIKPVMQEPYFNLEFTNDHLNDSDVRLLTRCCLYSSAKHANSDLIPWQTMRWLTVLFSHLQRAGLGGLGITREN